MTDHPYRRADDRAFWSRSVAADFDPGGVPDPPSFRLSRGDRFMSAGSCFGANVRRFLEAWGFDYVRTEKAQPQWPESAETAFYEAYSARYGNVYTARQMLQLLERATGTFRPQEDHWVAPDGRFIDPFWPGLRHRAWSLNELRALTEQHLRAIRSAVETATVLVFTLGLTEAWVSAADGAVFPACPGTVAGDYDPARHRFVNFSCAEITSDLDRLIGLLRKINPRIRVIITVSPVPMVATAEERHVMVATAYSKSVLRVAADEALRRHTDVAYFPGYEMTLWGPYSVSPFNSDRRTVREEVIAAVMNGFRAAYIDDQDAEREIAGPNAVEPLDALVAAALDDECEEMMADDRLWADAPTLTPSAVY